jgi:putative transcriptional regulator
MVMKATPIHHPGSELLLARAAGGLNPAIALVVSAHLDMCPRCAGRAHMLDMAGGALLEAMPAASLSPDALEETLARTGEAEPSPAGERGVPDSLKSVGLEHVPYSLRPLTVSAAQSHGWKKRPGGVREFVVHKSGQGIELRYLLTPPGTGVPRHTHRGMEFTLVVAGTFRDETGFYGPGDLAVATSDLTHRPVAGTGEPCLAFVVASGPVRFTGALGLFQRALGGG